VAPRERSCSRVGSQWLEVLPADPASCWRNPLVGRALIPVADVVVAVRVLAAYVTTVRSFSGVLKEKHQGEGRNCNVSANVLNAQMCARLLRSK
jgi:hypothetical protein